jgi:hypothetical protein
VTLTNVQAARMQSAGVPSLAELASELSGNIYVFVLLSDNRLASIKTNTNKSFNVQNDKRYSSYYLRHQCLLNTVLFRFVHYQ